MVNLWGLLPDDRLAQFVREFQTSDLRDRDVGLPRRVVWIIDLLVGRDARGGHFREIAGRTGIGTPAAAFGNNC